MVNEKCFSTFLHHNDSLFHGDMQKHNRVSVIAGHNRPERFETYYNFTINPKSFEIKASNQLPGDLIPEKHIKK